MRALTASLGALLLFSLVAPARAQAPTEEVGFVFTPIRLEIQDPGRTGLTPGSYGLAFDRARVAPGERLEVRLEAAGRVGEPLRVVIPAVAFEGCSAAAAFGPRSAVEVSALPDGGRRFQVSAEGSRSCRFRFEVPAAPGGSAPRQGIGAPGGLTLPEKPPQCSPPNFPSDAGSPQPSPLEPGLTATPVSPPDGGCELTEFPWLSRIQGVDDPALRGALSSLRSGVESLARTRPDDARGISSARSRIQRDLGAVSRAARSGGETGAAERCETERIRCERACGGRDCCCCTATYANCLLGH